MHSNSKEKYYQENPKYELFYTAPRKKIGIGTLGLFIQLFFGSGIVVYFVTSFYETGLQLANDTSISLAFKFFVLSVVFVLVFFIGFCISNKHKDRHIGALLAVNLYIEFVSLFFAFGILMAILSTVF